jgi:NTE family protein
MSASITGRPRVALVIGSGGIKCAAAIGVWRVLQGAGIEVDQLVGCSGGSLYAAALALGLDAARMEALTLSFWTPEVMKDYTANLRASQAGELRFDERSGLADDSYMNACLAQAFGEQTFADVQRPLQVVATDLHTGEQVLLAEGRLADALRASAAIPLIFPPKLIDGRLLVDGAVSNPLPLDVAMREGADLIIAIGFTLSTKPRLRSMLAVQAQLNSLYMNNILKATYAFHNLAHHAEIITIVPEFEKPLGMFDTDQLPYIIAEGERGAQEHLPYLERLWHRK